MIKKVTIKQFAEKHKIPRSTVSLWCRNGFLDGAVEENTPFGKVWMIPFELFENFNSKTNKPRRGRPKQRKEEIAA